MERKLESEVELPKVNPQVDIYDESSREILMFEDGIQVREQKEKRARQSQKELEEVELPLESTRKPRVNTDVILLQRSSGKFEYLSAPIDKAGNEIVSLAQVVQNRLIADYGKETFRLLWRGQVQPAVDYLQRQVQPKNAETLTELIGYLQKHESEITGSTLVCVRVV